MNAVVIILVLLIALLLLGIIGLVALWFGGSVHKHSVEV